MKEGWGKVFSAEQWTWEGQRKDGRTLLEPEIELTLLSVFLALSTGLFLFVIPGEAGSQLEPIDIAPSRLLNQSVCSQRAATGAQQLTSHIRIQVAVYLKRAVEVPLSCNIILHVPISLIHLLRAGADG